MDSKFGKDIQKYYNKNDILSVQYSKFVGASPDNNFFLNKIGTGFIHKINKLINSEKNEAQIHIDDEIPNMISEENKIKKFFIDLLKQLDNKMFDQGYSIGICLGNFIYNWESFYNSPNSNKAFNLATLSLAVFLPAIKLIPQIKSLIKKHLFNFCSFGINISTILNGLNILYAAFVEFKYIFSFSHEHKKKTIYHYGYKRGIKLAVGVGFSFLGNILGKLLIKGITVIIGVSLCPLTTIVISGMLVGTACGYLGTKIGDYLSDKAYGKDEFVLKSNHLYYKYIPMKYRKKYYNPNLKWNKTYLCNYVKSYIIECYVNEVDLIMLIINIPENVNEIDECLYYKNNFIDDDNESVSTEYSENEEKVREIFIKGKYGGDLIIPYKGIEENFYSINFVIYGINKEKINYKDWLKREQNEKIIEIVFNLTVY